MYRCHSYNLCLTLSQALPANLHDPNCALSVTHSIKTAVTQVCHRRLLSHTGAMSLNLLAGDCLCLCLCSSLWHSVGRCSSHDLLCYPLIIAHSVPVLSIGINPYKSAVLSVIAHPVPVLSIGINPYRSAVLQGQRILISFGRLEGGEANSESERGCRTLRASCCWQNCADSWLCDAHNSSSEAMPSNWRTCFHCVLISH